jgi:hypothetical protein
VSTGSVMLPVGKFGFQPQLCRIRAWHRYRTRAALAT